MQLPRFAFALLAWLSALSAPLAAFTVEEMKAMEAKVKKVVEKNMPAVVSLVGEKVSGSGSGTIVSADGLILTAAHVTRGNDHMIVVFPDGKQVRCTVLGADHRRDVSLAKIDQPGTYPFCEIGDSDLLEPTTIVIALGHPGGYDLRRTPPLRIGRVSSKNLGGFIVSDCTLIGGDSGGPLFDLEGKVIGVHSSIGNALTFNRCAPVNAAKVSWNKLLAGEEWGLPAVRSTFAGREGNKSVVGALLDPESEYGATLMEVYPQSPLEQAGLQTGDLITKLGENAVESSEQLVEHLGKTKPGDKVAITYRRGSTEMKSEVTLISRSEMNKRRGITERPRSRRPEVPSPAPANPAQP